MGWVAPSMAVADGTMVCAARWSHTASGDGMVYASGLISAASLSGGMGSPFGGHCRQHNSFRTPSSDFSCQFVFVCVQLLLLLCTKHALTA